jgi:hypothetical protein
LIDTRRILTMGKARAKRTRPSMAATAMPTQERLRQAGDAFEIGGSVRDGHIFRMLDAPLEQLYGRRLLTQGQYEALRRMRLHWFLGAMASSLRAVDLNRVQVSSWDALGQSERELMHRQAFGAGWALLGPLQRGVVMTVVLTEGGLTSAGAELGYRSPFRGRMAAMDLLRGAADVLMRN